MRINRRHKTILNKLSVLLLTGLVAVVVNVLHTKQASPPKTQPSSPALLEKAQVECGDVHVSDGDSIVATCAGERIRIRLQGIDAPEMGQVPYGQRAKEALAKQLGKTFTLHVLGQDYYQRTLAVVYSAGQDINELMIRQGYAVAYKGSDTPDNYWQAQAQAKAEKLGVWAEAGDQQDPKTWRRYQQ